VYHLLTSGVVHMAFWDRFLPKKDATADFYKVVDSLPSEVLAQIVLKASLLPQNQIGYHDIPIQNERGYDDDESLRRAISTVSNLYNVIGMPRPNFNRRDNDALAQNAYWALAEKSIMDYIATLSWSIDDKRGEPIDDEIEWLKHPNPQDTFPDILKASLPDLMRYDAGVWVKTFNKRGYVHELKSYYGPEFWKEIDRMPIRALAGPNQPIAGIWSHGYVARYWQRSRPGVYISFKPDEICYLSMYKRSDTVYGFDFIQTLKWQIQYLIDSTRAAGRTFANGVVPSIVWNHPQVHDIKALTQRITEVRQGNQGPTRFGSILHTVGEEKIDTLAHTLHDMEWLEGQRFVSQLVWAMWGFQPQEFAGESTNRATAYIGRNITKSKILYPLMRYMEDTINRDILPYREGYKEGNKFYFMKQVDLDDELKQCEIKATVANAASIYRAMGLTIESALTLAGAGDDIKSIQIDNTMLNAVKEDATMAGEHGEPKQFVRDSGKRKEGDGASPIKKIAFGDSEERQAGIKKGFSKITLSREDGVDIRFAFGESVGVVVKGKHPDSKPIAKEIVKIVQNSTKHNRERMADPGEWGDAIFDAVDKYELVIDYSGKED